jgi:hypothetical protein
MKQFRVGDRVVWDSQAGGTHIIKRGVVIAVLRPGEDPVAVHCAKCPHGPRLSGVPGEPRDHESYLIHEETKNLIYWPRVAALHLDGEDQ